MSRQNIRAAAACLFGAGQHRQSRRAGGKSSRRAASVGRAGKDIITLTASCGLMFKFEWPLIVPDNEDVKALSAATKDISEYVVDIANKKADRGAASRPQSIAMHLACHARANVGPKSAELLRLIPQAQVSVVERCSGHGGTFGVLKETRHLAVKVGRPAARFASRAGWSVPIARWPPSIWCNWSMI